MPGGEVLPGATVWLPSGVAVAGLWFLGPRAAVYVALVTLVARLDRCCSP